MEQIAVIYGHIQIYWSAVLLTMGAATAICVYLALYLPESRNAAGAALSIPVALVLALVFARLLHWYCRTDGYESFRAAMTDYSTGGYALSGAFFGCAAAAVLLRILGISKNLPQMLDCMAMGGCAGIGVGRLSFFFNNGDRGMILESLRGLPMVSPVINPVSGAEEYRLATFFLQAIAAAVVFAALLLFWMTGRRRIPGRDGEICLLFLLLYGATQVLLDSTRYDSLYFRSNGFVSVVQVLGALAMGLAVLVFSVRLVRGRGWRHWYLALWSLLAGLFGLGGYMEYYVQRRGHEAAFAYSVMGAALMGIVVLTLVIRRLEGKH